MSKNDHWARVAVSSWKLKRPTTRKGQAQKAEVSPTPEQVLRKAAALGRKAWIDAKGRLKTDADINASIEPLDLLVRPTRKDPQSGELVGLISVQEHQAGCAYRNLRIAALGPVYPPAAGGANLVHEHVGDSGLEDVRDLDDEDPEERAARRHRAWKEATSDIVREAGGEAFAVVRTVCVEGVMIPEKVVPMLRVGLQVLVRRWRIR